MFPRIYPYVSVLCIHHSVIPRLLFVSNQTQCVQFNYEKVFHDFVVEKPKYSAQNLTDEDREILYQVVFKYAMLFYNLTQKYASPKEYAKKEILKIIQSDKDIATLYTLIYAKNYPPDYLYKPGEINQKLANDMRNSIQQDYRDMTTQTDDDDEHHERFLHPRDLREKVLKNLESYGIILHLEGKDKIRHHQREVRRPGKKSLSDDDRGGKPSAYIVTEKVEKLKKAIEKPLCLYLRIALLIYYYYFLATC
jgi:hypothetical protein